MDSASEELLLQKIEEFVIDEDVIVTSSFLCEKLDVSLSESKHILEKYVSDDNLNPGKISVTHLVCGKLKTGEYSIQIVDSILLKEKKKLFGSIFNEVVYSVQKSNSIDFNAIALAEKANLTKTRAVKGCIVGEKCTERSIKSKVLPPPPPQKNFEKQKPSSFFKPVVKTESVTDKKAGPSTSTNVSKAQPQKKAGGLTGFLSQTNGKKQQLSKTSSEEEDVRETKRPRMETNGSDDIEIKVEKEPVKTETVNVQEAPHNGESSEVKTNGKSAGAKKKVNDKKKQDGKKRKRIILQSDSDDDIFANDEEEKMEVDSEEEKPVQVQPKEVVPRNKRRKAVEKVYTDEEGFVVTKTEYVLVSASEDEEVEVKEEKPKVVTKPSEKEEKKSPPQKGTAKGKKGKSVGANQPTLMSFFKKK